MAAVQRDLDRLGALGTDIERLRHSFSDIRDFSRGEFDQLLKRSNLEKWELRNATYRSILAGFEKTVAAPSR
jgi:hypothetical protein